MAAPSQTPRPVKVVNPADDVAVANPHNVSAIYSNSFGMSATLTDFTIYFLEVGQTPSGTGSVPKNDIKAIITLPLLAAGGLQEALQQILKQAAELAKQPTKD